MNEWHREAIRAIDKHAAIQASATPTEAWMRVRYIGQSTETPRYLEVEFDVAGKARRLLVEPDDLRSLP